MGLRNLRESEKGHGRATKRVASRKDSPAINISLFEWSIILSGCIIFTIGFFGYITGQNTKDAPNAVFTLIQVSTSLAGFTVLAELIDEGRSEIKRLFILSSIFLLTSVFFLLFGVLTTYGDKIVLNGIVVDVLQNGSLHDYSEGFLSWTYFMNHIHTIFAYLLGALNFSLGFMFLLITVIRLSKIDFQNDLD